MNYMSDTISIFNHLTGRHRDDSGYAPSGIAFGKKVFHTGLAIAVMVILAPLLLLLMVTNKISDR